MKTLLPLDCSGNLNPERAAITDPVTPTLAAARAGSTQGTHESTLCQHPAQYVMQNQRVSSSVDWDFNPPQLHSIPQLRFPHFHIKQGHVLLIVLLRGVKYITSYPAGYGVLENITAEIV